MKPAELLERLRVLSQCTLSINTVIVAPISPNMASEVTNRFRNYKPICSDGLVSAQDLREFVDYIETLQKTAGLIE